MGVKHWNLLHNHFKDIIIFFLQFLGGGTGVDRVGSQKLFEKYHALLGQIEIIWQISRTFKSVPEVFQKGFLILFNKQKYMNISQVCLYMSAISEVNLKHIIMHIAAL